MQVHGLCASVFAEADHEHLGNAAFDASSEVSIGLNPVDWHNGIGLRCDCRKVNWCAISEAPHLNYFHASHDWRLHVLFGHTEKGQNLTLAFGCCATMAALDTETVCLNIQQ